MGKQTNHMFVLVYSHGSGLVPASKKDCIVQRNMTETAAVTRIYIYKWCSKDKVNVHTVCVNILTGDTHADNNPPPSLLLCLCPTLTTPPTPDFPLRTQFMDSYQHVVKVTYRSFDANTSRTYTWTDINVHVFVVFSLSKHWSLSSVESMLQAQFRETVDLRNLKVPVGECGQGEAVIGVYSLLSSPQFRECSAPATQPLVITVSDEADDYHDNKLRSCSMRYLHLFV